MAETSKSVLQFRVDPPQKQRRWTALLRFFLYLGQIPVAAVVYAVYLGSIFGWFVAIFTGRNPYAKTSTAALRWYARTSAYLLFLTDKFPPLSWSEETDYPVQIEMIDGRLNRLTVLFRIFLAIPILIVDVIYVSALYLFAVVAWFIVSITGRLPAPLHNLFELILRFHFRVYAYMALLQNPYPGGLFGDDLFKESSDTEEGDAPESPNEDIEQSVSSTVAGYEIDLGATALNTDQMLAPLEEGPVDGSSENENETDGENHAGDEGTSWKIQNSRGSRILLIVALVLGIAFQVVWWTEVQPHLPQFGTTSVTTLDSQQWSDGYRSTIVNIDNAIDLNVGVLKETPLDWSQIKLACTQMNSAWKALDTTPQYPIKGPDAILLEGVRSTYAGINGCLSEAVPQKSSSQLTQDISALHLGVSQFKHFLREIPQS